MIDPKLELEVNLLHQRVCSAFADPTRVLILYALADAPMCVTDLADKLGIPQSTTSRHLRVLRERSLVIADRRGNAVFYSVSDDRLIQALDLLRGVLTTQLSQESDIAQSLT